MSKKNRRRITASCTAVLTQARWLLGLRNGQRLLARMLALRATLTRGLTGGAIAAALVVAPLRASGPFVDPAIQSNGRPALIDLDDDGDLDAVIGHRRGTIGYLENQHSGMFDGFVPQAGVANPFAGIDVGNSASPTFVDLDGDGDQDLLVGNSYGYVRYYRNDAGSFSEETATSPFYSGGVYTDFGFSVAPTFVDFDGDNDPDLFLGHSDGTVRYYQNDAGVFSEQTAANPFYTGGVYTDFGSYAIPTFIDIDGDGDLDAFITSNSTNPLRYFNNDGGTFTEQDPATLFSGPPLANFGYTALAWGDLDNDNDFDAFMGAKNDRLLFYRNSGSAASPSLNAQTSFPLATEQVAYYAAPDFVDLDGDGDQDLFVGVGDGTVRYFRNDGGSFSEQTGENPLDGSDFGYGIAPGFADRDGDGDQDLFLGTGDGFVRYFRNDSGTFSEQTGANPVDGIDFGYNAVPRPVDFDGDGDQDLFVAVGDGFVRYFRNDAGSFSEQPSANPFDGIDFGYDVVPAFIDIDNDADLDIFLGEGNGSVRFYRNDSGTFTEQTGSDNPLGGIKLDYGPAPAFLDVDGDSDQDAFIGNDVGSVAFFTNSAAPAAPTGLTATATSPTQIDLSWSDPNTVETAYVIERSPDGSSNWTEIASLPPDSTSYSDTGLAEETNYFYRVQARNNNFSSPFATVSASTDPAVPAAPTGLSVTAVSATQVDLSWTDASTNETGFVVERSPDGSTWSDIATLPADSTSYSDTGLSASTTYYYRVRAVRSGASDSAPTTAASVTTPNAPGEPADTFDVYLPLVVR